MDNDLEYKLVKPDKSLGDFVESFWLLQSHSDNNKDVIVLPDGRIDLVFYKSTTKSFEITLVGLGTQYEQATITPKHLAYAVSFKPHLQQNIFFTKTLPICGTPKRIYQPTFGVLVRTT
jgi:hypothetical protein